MERNTRRSEYIIRLVVSTPASTNYSDKVVISSFDCERVGLDWHELPYSQYIRSSFYASTRDIFHLIALPSRGLDPSLKVGQVLWDLLCIAIHGRRTHANYRTLCTTSTCWARSLTLLAPAGIRPLPPASWQFSTCLVST